MSDSSSRIASHRWASPDVPDDERHRHVFTYIRSIEQNQSDIRLQMFRDAYLYTGEELSGLSIEWVGRSTITPDRARMNFVGGLIETARSRIAQRRPRLAVTSRAANWSLRQKAIGLERYLDGDFVRTKFARTAQRVFRDGAAVGTGIGKVYAWGGKVNVDRIFPLEVVVDEEACGSGLPMEMFQRRFIDVDLAIAEYGDGKPELEDMIWRSAKGDGRWTGYIKYNKNLVPIVDAYRRPSATGADDGLHVMCVKEGVIVQEDCAMLPFIVFRWQEKMTGWYGLGIPDLVYWLQARLNRHAAFEEACQDRHANPRVVVDGQLDAQLSQSMTNEIGVIVPSYGRFPPKFENPPAVPPEIYRDEDRKIEMMHHVIGLSESSVSGRKEPGLDSAPGQREWQGWQEGRFSSQVEGYDDLYVEGAELYIHTAKKLVEEGHEPEASWHSPRYGLVNLKWSDVDMERDCYRLRVQPSSSLSTTPAGLRERIEEERAAGRLSDDIYLYFVQTLDVDAYFSLFDAAVGAIMRSIEANSSPDKSAEYIPPDEFMANELGIKMYLMEYNRLLSLDAPQFVLRRFRSWIEQAEYLAGTLGPPAAAQAVPGQQSGAGSPAGLAPPPFRPPGALSASPAPAPTVSSVAGGAIPM